MIWLFCSVLVLVSAWVFTILRAERFAFAWYDRLHSTKLEPVSALPKFEPLPMDLMKLASQESEVWAREGVVRAMYDMYEKTRDWNVVRAAIETADEVN